MAQRTQSELKTEIEALRARIQVLEAEQNAQREEEAYLAALHQTTLKLMNRHDLDDVLKAIIQQAAELAGTEHGFLYLLEPDENVMRAVTTTGLLDKYLDWQITAKEGGMVSAVWRTGKPIVIYDYDQWENRLETAEPGLFKSGAALPLHAQGRVIGVIALVYVEAERQFTESTLRMLRGFADLAAIALDNARMYHQLSENRQFLSRITDSVPGVVYVFDLSTMQRMYTSSGMKAILGYKPDEIPLDGFAAINQLIHPEDIPKLKARIDAALRGEWTQLSDHVLRVRHKAGHWLWINAQGTVTTDENGHLCVTSIVQDITEQRHMENSLKESEQRFRTLADTAPVMIWMTHPNGSNVFVNQTWLKFTGRTFEQELGDGWMQTVHPDDLDSVVQFAYRSYETRSRQHVDFRMRYHDGSYRWVRNTAIPRFANDEFLGFVGTCVDIHEMKQAEEALRSSETRLRTLLGTVPAIVFYFQGGEIIYINEFVETLLGHTPDELHGPIDWSRMPPEMAADMQASIRNQTQNPGNEIRCYQMKTWTKTGETRILDLRIASLPLDGEVIFLGVAVDITDQKQVEEQALLLALERERVNVLANFVRDVGHDFRNPLATLNTSVYLLERTRESQERFQHHVGVLKQQVEHLSSLVDGLLTMSRLDSETILERQPADLNGLIRELVQEFNFRALNKSQSIQLDLSDDLPSLSLNSAELYRALENLLENAALYSAEGETITIKTQLVDQSVRVSVIDNGVGISTAQMERVFERFYRVDESRSSIRIGLGLPIARRIVELHGGRITAESTPGQGSQFHIDLPL